MKPNPQWLAMANLVLGGLAFLLGLVIVRENPRQRLNRVVSLLLFFGGLGAVLSALTLLLPVEGRGLQTRLDVLWEFFFPTAFLLASVFPEERSFTRPLSLPGGRRGPAFEWLVFAPHVFHFLLVLATERLPETRGSGAAHGIVGPLLGVAGVFGRLFLAVHQALFSLVDLGFGGAAVVLLLDSLRRTRVPRLRQQLAAITVGLVGCLFLYAAATTVPTLLGRPLGRSMQAWLTTAALTLGSGAIAYAMVRHQFLALRLIARRGILYAVASAVLVGAYLLGIDRVNGLLAASLHLDRRVLEPVFLVIALAMFQPVVARLEQWLDGLFLRDPNDYRNVLRALGRDLQTTIDLEGLLERSARTLADALLPGAAHVVAFTPDGPRVHTGAGAALTSESLAALPGLAARLPREAASLRLVDGDAIAADADRALLTACGAELVVPLRWRGEDLGLVLLGRKLTGTVYTSEDTTLLHSLATQMGVSLQNALLLRDRLQRLRLEQELDLARQIQQNLLRQDFPVLAHGAVHGVALPSRQVGGDYHDVVQAPDGSHLVAIADVAGKGVPAALLSSMLQAALRTQAESGGSPAQILRGINSLVYRTTAANQFATFFLARVSADGRRLTYTNAGHNWPLLVRADGRCEWLSEGGTLLGILGSLPLGDWDVALEPGDLLLLYTDGISEATDAAGEQFGEERLAEFVRALPRSLTPEQVAHEVLGAVERHLAGLEPQDDRTLLVLRAGAVPAPVTVPGD